ncbi:MAG: hypothetical protein IJU90_03760 [Bacteroidales bacterium]|nr:hypothetical protein [Bacteroidales bacterium]
MEIKNVKGSSKVSPKAPEGYSSWLNYWEENMKKPLKDYMEYECPACKNYFTRQHFDGCHVQKADSSDGKWYIVPLCDSCNHCNEPMDIDSCLLLDVPSHLKVTYSE